MPNSVWSTETLSVISQARRPRRLTVDVDGTAVPVSTPFPSPEDWRDQWIYQILVDRFNNDQASPRSQWD